MADLIPGIGNVDWFNIAGIGQIMYYIGMGLLLIIILGVFAAALHVMKFKIKATVIPLYGSGEDGIFSFGKPKKNRIRWINHKTAWMSLWPLFNKVEREPFSSEFIYPGNQIYIYELENEWAPGRQNVSVKLNEQSEDKKGKKKNKIEKKVNAWLKKRYPNKKWVVGEINVNLTEDEVRAKINPVPFHVRNWQSLTYRKHEIEYAKQDFWTQNKLLFVTLGVILICGVISVATIYFVFQFAGGAKESMDLLANAIQGMQNIPASGVIPK